MLTKYDMLSQFNRNKRMDRIPTQISHVSIAALASEKMVS